MLFSAFNTENFVSVFNGHFRITALHAVGLGFESLVSHYEPACEAGFFVLISPAVVPVLLVVQNVVLLPSIFGFVCQFY